MPPGGAKLCMPAPLTSAVSPDARAGVDGGEDGVLGGGLDVGHRGDVEGPGDGADPSVGAQRGEGRGVGLGPLDRRALLGGGVDQLLALALGGVDRADELRRAGGALGGHLRERPAAR